MLPEVTQCALDERPPPTGIVATGGCKAAGSGSVDRLASQTFQNIDRTNLLDKIAKKKVWALTDQGWHEIRQTSGVAALQNINGQPSRCTISGVLDLSAEVMLFLSKPLEGGGSLLTGTGIPHEHAASPRIMAPKKDQ